MNQRLIAEIGKSQRLRVVNRLKRTQGLSVRELAAALGMSYMGIKQHCIELERRGYLDTWRRPKAAAQVGRPEMVYRLTRKAHELFPKASNEMTLALLESAQSLYGGVAPEKLLFLVFQRKTDGYIARVKGETVEARAQAFAAIRDAEGCLAELEKDEEGVRIVEHHSPFADLLAAYPALFQRLEQEMFGRVLCAQVTREQTEASGLYECVFRVGKEIKNPVKQEVTIPEDIQVKKPVEQKPATQVDKTIRKSGNQEKASAPAPKKRPRASDEDTLFLFPMDS